MEIFHVYPIDWTSGFWISGLLFYSGCQELAQNFKEDQVLLPLSANFWQTKYRKFLSRNRISNRGHIPVQ